MVQEGCGYSQCTPLFRKEVIIHDPDYTRIPEELKALSVDCREYADRKGLKRAPNYFKLWMTDSQDEAVEDINERLESLIDECRIQDPLLC